MPWITVREGSLLVIETDERMDEDEGPLSGFRSESSRSGGSVPSVLGDSGSRGNPKA